MLAADTFRPDQWHDFFIMVGGAAVAMVSLAAYSVSGAWLLLVGAHEDERRRGEE